MAGITARDIAARLGISPSAVSLALNGKPGVSEQTRKDVLALAAEMGYRGIQKQLPVSRHCRISFVLYVNELISIAENTTFSSFVLQGVESVASAMGFSTQVRYLRAGESIERQSADICRDTDGIILLGTDVTEKSLPGLEPFFTAAADVPLVVVDCFLLSHRYDCVVNDNFGGVREAVSYLVSRGCTHIGYLRSRHRIENFSQREAGMRAALADAGLEPDISVNCGITFDGAIEDVNKWLDANPSLPDAFFAENDIIAAAALRSFKSHGVSVPSQVSVIGFDDIPICDLTDPTLTTVHSYKDQLGEVAVNLLRYRLSGANGSRSGPSGNLQLAVTTSLCIRSSVK